MTPLFVGDITLDALFIGAVVAACAFSVLALAQDGRRALVLLALSSLGWFGIIYGKVALNISLIHLLAGILGFAGLFICISSKPAVYLRTAAVLCALSVIGLPPFLGFWPKLVTLLSASRSGHIWLSAVLALAMLFSLLALLKFIDRIPSSQDKGGALSYAALTAGGLSFILGLFIKQVSNILGIFVK